MGLKLRKSGVCALLLTIAWMPARAQPARPAPAVAGAPEVAALLNQADQAMDRGDSARASALFAQVLEKAPDLKQARFGYGAALVAQGNVDAGLAEVDRSLGSDADAENLYAVVALLRRAEGGPSSARQDRIRQYLERAYQSAEVHRYADSKDPKRVTVAALLALNLQREQEFRAAAATLVRDYPDRMPTHYLNGIRAAMDQKWVESEDELLKAGRMGLPQAEVDRLLAQGIHANALPHRLAWYGLIAVVLWAGGLGGLFLVGRGLSAMTLRSLRTEDPNRSITALERMLRRVYQLVIGLAGVYYYISLPVVAVLAIAIAVALGYGLFLLPRIPIKAIVLVLAFFGAMLMMIVSIIRSCFVRVKEFEPDRTLSPEEAPRLWELTRAVAAEVGTRPIDQIWLTSGTELAVLERGNWLARARDRARRVLILGMGVVDGFRIDGFRAVLAHEYGHFLHRDTAGGDVALRVGRTMHRFAEAMIKQNNAQWWNLGWQFLRLYHFLFQRITHGASRLQEIHADRIAIRTCGKDAFAGGLRHVVRRSIEFSHSRALAFHRAAQKPAEPATPGSGRFQLVEEASLRRRVETDFAGLWQSGSTEDDTHPSPAERVRLAERLGTERRLDSQDGWLIDLFADPGQIRAEYEGKLATELAAQRAAFTAYHDQLIAQLTAFINQNPRRGDAFLERGNIQFQKGDFARAVADYDNAIRFGIPQPAIGYFNRGVACSRLGDDKAAATFFEEALKRDADQAMGLEIMTELGDLRARSGALEEAVAAYDQAITLRSSAPDPDLFLKRAEVHCERGDFARAVADYTQVLTLDARCAEAYAGRARAELGRGAHRAAAADLAAALDLEPNKPAIRQLLDTLQADGAPAAESAVASTGTGEAGVEPEPRAMPAGNGR